MRAQYETVIQKLLKECGMDDYPSVRHQANEKLDKLLSRSSSLLVLVVAALRSVAMRPHAPGCLHYFAGQQIHLPNDGKLQVPSDACSCEKKEHMALLASLDKEAAKAV